ncbi:hypothetical protein ASE61_18500 [Bosea sp. Root670]|jgi:hypothetical protein|uniref:Major facilitator superfamily (MFS) profile domain-containing protein n=1 Tax=Bosea robiniae TaxID=1036780 RepID=A0ABY0P1S7_9HYPH|nr:MULTISPECIES: hypothetical protein [Bosea]KRE00960.1 hypothetical protein ASE61_18500 [Bosea sp. Root670]TQI74903.1 hypothetical protein FHT98_2670 [Bosea sp. AK1]SDG54003.1 hypothetical protein SAMN05421844_104290 [Bosea robiniae]
MFGGIGSFITSEVSGVVRRNVTVYGLFGLAALLMLCAGGYALNALHTVLALRYGAVAASLWIAGGLFLAALLALGMAVIVKNRRRPPRPAATAALAAAPLAAKLIGSRLSWRMAAAGGIVVLGAILGRQIVAGGADDDGEA